MEWGRIGSSSNLLHAIPRLVSSGGFPCATDSACLFCVQNKRPNRIERELSRNECRSAKRNHKYNGVTTNTHTNTKKEDRNYTNISRDTEKRLRNRYYTHTDLFAKHSYRHAASSFASLLPKSNPSVLLRFFPRASHRATKSPYSRTDTPSNCHRP